MPSWRHSACRSKRTGLAGRACRRIAISGCCCSATSKELDTEQLIAWRRRLAEHANVSGLRPQRGPTDDATHGARQLTSYSGHYDGWRYLPLLPFLIFDLESEK